MERSYFSLSLPLSWNVLSYLHLITFHLECCERSTVFHCVCEFTFFHPWRSTIEFFMFNLAQLDYVKVNSSKLCLCCLRLLLVSLLIFCQLWLLFSDMEYFLRIGHDDAILRNVFFLFKMAIHGVRRELWQGVRNLFLSFVCVCVLFGCVHFFFWISISFRFWWVSQSFSTLDCSRVRIDCRQKVRQSWNSIKFARDSHFLHRLYSGVRFLCIANLGDGKFQSSLTSGSCCCCSFLLYPVTCLNNIRTHFVHLIFFSPVWEMCIMHTFSSPGHRRHFDIFFYIKKKFFSISYFFSAIDRLRVMCTHVGVTFSQVAFFTPVNFYFPSYDIKTCHSLRTALLHPISSCRREKEVLIPHSFST
jgi:hypothetical protein